MSHYVNIGYAIRRTFKPSVVAQHEEQAKASGYAYVRSPPDYLLPNEGYRWSGPLPAEGLRLGWGRQSEAEQALVAAENQAIEHGYEVNWSEYDYKVVKVTVTEEDA